MTLEKGIVEAVVYVTETQAIMSGFGRFGRICVKIPLDELSEDEKILLASFGLWVRSGNGMFMRGMKAEYLSDETAVKDETSISLPEAVNVPPTYKDVLVSLAERRSREPANLLREEIAEKHKAKKPKRDGFFKRLFGLVD